MPLPKPKPPTPTTIGVIRIELADVLGTLIAQLVTYGILGA